jgi:hypothetical protein
MQILILVWGRRHRLIHHRPYHHLPFHIRHMQTMYRILDMSSGKDMWQLPLQERLAEHFATVGSPVMCGTRLICPSLHPSLLSNKACHFTRLSIVFPRQEVPPTIFPAPILA